MANTVAEMQALNAVPRIAHSLDRIAKALEYFVAQDKDAMKEET